MVGRADELKILNELYESKSFEFLIMYGRRRIGKTTLLQEFSKDKKTAIIIDEFPFIAQENPTIKSMLQHVIDHLWKNNTNIFLILCGSSVSFMENEVLGQKSPLHDRQTSCMEILPFDYLESSLFYPKYTNEEKLLSYGILGGVPRYLEVFDDKLSIEKNISQKIIKRGSYLNEEPANLLRAELRDPNTYNSILSSIANGKNRINEIADFIHEERSKVSKYLITLQALRLVEKMCPAQKAKAIDKKVNRVYL